ncbi:integrator complex subunit 12-like isoform X2 [Bombus vosnesenskii]|uniref:Integrator complex subunit 12 n=2 Tax=Pyrobombus TaxID=144703 RepID=A0A6J3K5I8_9HYME|nr:integrator complex subunit 12-like isoform X2 [Bombus vancouverensis nearcticus]XP_033319461.1 integrator complex subunit 12-like isoform X2 [Bombus bifarius]XP_033348343.1 integrator complex subunit 12-like isoform X2 [Bombus vosnesenskii]XP_050490653.1 integrator complex subunit 12-like isoform X3 [Bombus huntii]
MERGLPPGVLDSFLTLDRLQGYYFGLSFLVFFTILPQLLDIKIIHIKMSQLELDPQFTQGLHLLHSTNKDSAEQLRALLDEAIKQKYGPSKMLSNVLHKKYMMEEPVLSDHSSSSSSKKSKSSSSSSSKHSSKSSKNSSPVNLPTRDTPPDIIQTDNTLALEILEDDLTCVICKGMDVGARNRLVECSECHSLYHQECHIPHILDSQIDVPGLVWYCSNCSKSQVSKERSSPKTVIENKSKEQKKSNSVITLFNRWWKQSNTKYSYYKCR